MKLHRTQLEKFEMLVRAMLQENKTTLGSQGEDAGRKELWSPAPLAFPYFSSLLCLTQTSWFYNNAKQGKNSSLE